MALYAFKPPVSGWLSGVACLSRGESDNQCFSRLGNLYPLLSRGQTTSFFSVSPWV